MKKIKKINKLSNKVTPKLHQNNPNLFNMKLKRKTHSKKQKLNKN